MKQSDAKLISSVAISNSLFHNSLNCRLVNPEGLHKTSRSYLFVLLLLGVNERKDSVVSDLSVVLHKAVLSTLSKSPFIPTLQTGLLIIFTSCD